MRRSLYTALFVLIGFCLVAGNTLAQSREPVDIMDMEAFQRRVLQDNDTLYVVNFWATWCTPCVRELPHFQSLKKKFSGQPVQFILMSLDALDNISQVNTFLRKKKIDMEVHLFAGGDPNIWINVLEPSWQGSIPATFLYQKGRKLSFKEASFSTKQELEFFIKNHR